MDLKSATLTYSQILLPEVGIRLAAIIRSAAAREERNEFWVCIWQSRSLSPCSAMAQGEKCHDLQCISFNYPKNQQLFTLYRKQMILNNTSNYWRPAAIWNSDNLCYMLYSLHPGQRRPEAKTEWYICVLEFWWKLGPWPGARRSSGC